MEKDTDMKIRDTENNGSANRDRIVSARPRVLYFGTPVVLVCTVGRNGRVNLAPISSAWALGYSIVMGIGEESMTMENLRDTGECTLSFPERYLWRAVEKLAHLTGKFPVPADKKESFRYEPDKFAAAGLTPSESVMVNPPGVEECRLRIEASVEDIRPIKDQYVKAGIVEVKALHVMADTGILADSEHIDPASWNPLIYSFRHYFSLGRELGKTFRSEI